MIQPASRLRALPRYAFEELLALRDQTAARGVAVLDMGVGNPDARPPAQAITALVEAAQAERPNYHRYASFNGLPELRRAAAAWYGRRFNVHLDPDREVLPVLGSKEGLYHLMQAYVDPGDIVLIPSPCYPAYLGAARLAEATIVELPLSPRNRWLIDFSTVESETARGAKLLLMNYPNNPTGAICDLDHYRDAIAFCRDFDILLASDIAYSELSLTDGHVPASVFELPGARQQAVEFSSLSKSYAMAGWRVGFCVGNAEAVGNLLRLKCNVDFGMFLAVQKGAEAALSGDDRALSQTRRMLRRRAALLCGGLRRLGWEVDEPAATLYAWARVPPPFGEDDVRFVFELLERAGVLLTHGSAFGTHGRGYVRISLSLDEAGIDAALSRIESSGILQG
jgi:LL-diaminopimelate aminotransferase